MCMRLHYSGEVQRKKKTVQIHSLREFYSVQINTGNDGKEAIKFSDINSVQNERDALHCSSLLFTAYLKHEVFHSVSITHAEG